MKRSQLRSSTLFFSIFLLFSPSILISTTLAQDYSYYLNKIGECNFVVGYDVNVAGDYAYVTNNDGVMIVDVSNPSRPTKVSEILTDQGPFAIRINGDYCFVAFSGGEFLINDISDPLNPQTVISSSASSGIVSEIVVAGTYVFVSYREVGYRIFNFSNTDFDLIHFYPDSNGESLAVKDDILYFGNPNAGIKVFNISDITAPVYIRTLTTATSVWDMYIHDNILYVGCHGAGIRIYNISNLSNPSLLRSLSEDDGGEAQGVAADDDYLYVADNWGVEAYNMSNPSLPVEVAEVTNGIGAAHDLDIDENYIYVAIGGGLEIFELSDIKSFYFPRYLYYIIPIVVVVIGGGIFLIIKLRKRKKA
ncbi:MAG: LVIVD repeat-containing protein [Promethearchaeota archaeon]